MRASLHHSATQFNIRLHLTEDLIHDIVGVASVLNGISQILRESVSQIDPERSAEKGFALALKSGNDCADSPQGSRAARGSSARRRWRGLRRLLAC